MTPMQAVEIAAKWLETEGLVADGLSAQSCSRYYRLPGRLGVLRVSDHAAKSCISVVVEDLVYAYKNSIQRDERDIGLDAEQVEEWAEWSLERYLEAEEPEAEDDDL